MPSLAEQSEQKTDQGEIREFLMVLRQAFLMVSCWIERRYGLSRKDCPDCPLRR